MPRAGALMVVYCRFSSACARLARACCDAGLGRRGARLASRLTCCGPVCAVCSSACACCSPARACTELALGDADAGLGFGDLRPRRIGRGFLRVGGRDRRVELLLRDFVLREQAAQPLDVARGLGRVGLGFAQRAPAPWSAARARPRAPRSAPSTPPCACVDAAAAPW